MTKQDKIDSIEGTLRVLIDYSLASGVICYAVPPSVMIQGLLELYTKLLEQEEDERDSSDV